jgi:site-specific DNA-adenine methylase
MGNKYDLIEQLIPLFPDNIDTFYDLFGGSAVLSINVKANKTVYNELN